MKIFTFKTIDGLSEGVSEMLGLRFLATTGFLFYNINNTEF